MLLPETEKKIVELFQLNSFRSGTHVIEDADGNSMGFSVEMLWAVLLSYYRYPSIVAVLHSPQGAKGLFFVPDPELFPMDDLGIVTSPVNTVDLPGDWEDPVKHALRSVNMTVLKRSSRRTVADGLNTEYDFWVHVCTEALYAEISAYGPKADPTWDRLGMAILATVKTIVDQYDDQEMRKFLKTVPHYRRQPG